MLARARGPARRTLSALAGRFVALRGWERLGFARLRDYAVERVGLSARALQDLAHVDAALKELPRVEAALVSGEINWTKARLLARAASPSDESRWLEFAVRLTAKALAREVRAVDLGCVEVALPSTDEDGAPEEERATVQIRCTPQVRARWYAARQLARRVAGEALPVWGCMEAIAAEVLSALPLDASPNLDAVAEQDPVAEPIVVGETDGTSWGEQLGAARGATRSAANGCAMHLSVPEPETDSPAPDPPPGEFPSLLTGLLTDLETLDAFELDRRLRAAVAFEQRLEARLAPLLLHVAEGRLYRAGGFANLEQYARERVGISPRKARALLRLERAGRHCPALMHAYREGRLSWVQAHTIVPVVLPVAAPRFARGWIDWARGVSVRRLEDDVDRALLLHETDPEAWSKTAGLPELCADLCADACAGLREPDPDRQTGARSTVPNETARLFFNAPLDVARLFRAVLCTARRRIERLSGRLPTEGEALDAMFDHAFEAWGARRAGKERVRREHRVFARDGWRCTVPGCSSYRNLHDHHIVFRSAGGSDELANRTTLCAWHHLRGMHARRVRCTGQAPHHLRFELGLRDDRPPLVRYGPGERLERTEHLEPLKPLKPLEPLNRIQSEGTPSACARPSPC